MNKKNLIPAILWPQTGGVINYAVQQRNDKFSLYINIKSKFTFCIYEKRPITRNNFLK